MNVTIMALRNDCCGHSLRVVTAKVNSILINGANNQLIVFLGHDTSVIRMYGITKLLLIVFELVMAYAIRPHSSSFGLRVVHFISVGRSD